MLHEDDVLPRGTESPFLTALHAKNATTQQTFSAINLASQQKTALRALLFFSGN